MILTQKQVNEAVARGREIIGERSAVNTWTDAARAASAASRKRHGLEGAGFQMTPEYMHKNAEHHMDMEEHHDEELRLQPTDKREDYSHREKRQMHRDAAYHYSQTERHLKSGYKARAEHHLRLAERHSVDADRY